MSRIQENKPTQPAKPPQPRQPVASASVPAIAPMPDSLKLSENSDPGLTSRGVLFVKSKYEDLRDRGATAYGYAETGYTEIKRAVQTGDWERPVQTLVDPVLDSSVLGPDNVFDDKGAGKFGQILTNRLGIGESVSLEVTTGATIPLEEFLIPNAKIDRGGSLKISRVAKKDQNGKPLTGPKDSKGNPPTELRVEVELEGSVGGSYAGKIGFDGSVKVGKREAGVKAMAGAEVEAGIRGKVAYTYAFDPDDPKEMNSMIDLVTLTASSTLSAIPDFEMILPGIRAAFGKHSDFTSHLVSLTGEGGLYAQASARLRVTAGISKSKDEEDSMEAEGLKTKSLSLLNKVNSEMRVAMMTGGARSSANLGVTKDVRTGEKTVYARVDGMVGANGRLPLYNVRAASIEGCRTVAFTYDQKGNLKGVKVQDEVSKDQFNKGLRSVMEDMMGRPFEKGLIAQIGTEDAIRVTYNLSPAEFESMDAKSFGEALLNKKKVASIEILSLHRDIFELKGAVAVDLGAQIGLRAGVMGIHEQESGLR